MISAYAIPGINVSTEAYINRIIDMVCIECGVEREVLKSRNRSEKTVEARQISFYILSNTIKLTRVSVGMEFDRDHSTVTHALKVISGLIDVDKDFNERMKNLMQRARRIKVDTNVLDDDSITIHHYSNMDESKQNQYLTND